MWEDKPFCCEGCKTVYQILNENKLSSYYDIYETPGIKVELQDFGSKYAYLDKEEIRDKLIYFTEGEYSKVKLYIPDIHCSSCIWLLENLYQLNPAITQSMVNFVKKEVDITFKNTEITLRQVVELLASIHYIPLINLESISGEANKLQNKKLIYKLGIAGFAFGNTMLLSMPEYIPGEVSPEFRSFFGWLNLLLAIPVLVYSANDYILSAWKNLKHKIINIDMPITIGIFSIFFESAYEIISGSGTGYMDSLTGLVFFLLIGKWYQNKTYQALSFERDYKSYFPVAVTRINGDKEEFVALEEIKAGDRIIVHNQEIIPADSILIKGEANINYSFVTGESKPVYKRSGDELYAGGKQIGATIELEVTKEVMQSRLTQLWNQDLHDSGEKEKDLTTMVDTVSKYFTIAILSIAAITAVAWWFIDPSVIIFSFTSVLIVACPCALALSIPFTYGNTMRIFGRMGFYLKKSTVIEKITHIDTVVFDKTGTITYTDLLSVEYHGKQLSDKELFLFKSLSRQSTHPLSTAVFEYIESDYTKEVEEYREIPASGIIGIIDGKTIRMGSADFIGCEPVEKSDEASMVYASIDGVYAGAFSVKNKYREGMEEIITKLKTVYDVHLISGDNDAEEKRLRKIFGEDSELRFNQTPVQKLEFIKDLRAKGKNVLMIGDGLNDAGALNESDLGISIADDVFSFSPACDAILEANKFKFLPDFLFKSKSSVNVVYASFALSLVYNVVGLYFAVTGQLSPIIAAILMPVSSVSVVAFVTLATNFNLRKMRRQTGKQKALIN
jgi:Cu+-exporting ATPase